MVGTPRRVVIACVAFALLLGAALHGADLGGVDGLDRGSDRSRSAVVADSTPAGVIAPAVRFRSLLSSDYVIESRWTKSGAADVALSGTLGLGMAALAWWLSRRDRGADGPLPRRSPPALRAPPALAFP